MFKSPAARFWLFILIPSVILFVLVPIVSAQSPPPRTTSYDHATIHTNTPAAVQSNTTRSKTSLYTADFQDASGNPDSDGWIGKDLSAITASRWHVDAFNSPRGGLGMWCGEMFPPCYSGDIAEGYGNNYREALDWSYTVADPWVATTVTITYDLNYDTAAPDALYLQYGSDIGMVDLHVYSGSTYSQADTIWVPLLGQSDTFTIQPNEYIGTNHDEILLRFFAWSDNIKSDQDCGYRSSGFAQVDNITVSIDGKGIVSSDDFEGGPSNWITTSLAGAGEYANIWPNLTPVDDCAPNTTPHLAFFDTDHPCNEWCYDSRQSTVNPDPALHDIFHSPPIVWPSATESGALFQFDVYRHFVEGDEASGVAYVWYVRSVDSGNPADLDNAPWRSHDLAYTGAPGYITQVEDITTLLVPGRTHVQLALGVRNNGPGTAWNGDETTPAPYFDNVELSSYEIDGPAMSAHEADLAQDNFPDIETIDYVVLGNNSVRFDAAVNIGTDASIVPGDSISVSIVPTQPGTTISTAEIHYRINTNDLFMADRYPYPDHYSHMYPVVGTTFSFDLPEEGLLYPGDVMHYYIKAVDSGGVTSTLPADLSDLDDFSHTSTYDKAFTLYALPTMFSDTPGDQPTILLWDDAPGTDGDVQWDLALRQLGLVRGVEYDEYWTTDPVAGHGNGLGGRATADQLAGYRTILYSCGEVATYTLDDNDLRLLDDPINGGWLQQGDKGMTLTGDNLAFDLSRSTTGSGFLASRMGVQLVSPDVRPLIGGQKYPGAKPVSPYTEPPSWHVNGLEPNLNQFDAVLAAGGGVRVGEFTDSGGNTGVYNYSAWTLLDDGDNYICSMPYDLGVVATPKVDGGTNAASMLETFLMNMGYVLGAGEGIPDLTLSTAELISIKSGSVFILPAGTGLTLGESGFAVLVTLLDSGGYPIMNFPFEDISLAGAYEDAGDLVLSGNPRFCEPSHADYSTDVNGQTMFEHSIIYAGGHSGLGIPEGKEEDLYVCVGGYPIADSPIDLMYNSADINGDRIVDLLDLALFVEDYYGAYQYRSDFVYDSAIDLFDALKMRSNMGSACVDPRDPSPDWRSYLECRFDTGYFVMFPNWSVPYTLGDLTLYYKNRFLPSLDMNGFACCLVPLPAPSLDLFTNRFALDSAYSGFNVGNPVSNQEDIVASFIDPISTTETSIALGTVGFLYQPSYGAISIDVHESISLTYDHAITTTSSEYFELTKNKNGPVHLTECWINPDKPILEGIYDVPDDEGLAVRIDTWRSAYEDPAAPVVVTHYEVYRQQLGKLDGWDLVASVPGDGEDHKQFFVPTHCDSTAAGLCTSTFMVRACTADSLTYFDSDLISGYSIDNLPPANTGGVVVDYHYDSVFLSWTASAAPDFAYYNIYRGTDPELPPIGGEPYAQAAVNQWTDDLSGAPGTAFDYVYWIAAVDDAGQEGDWSAWEESTTTNVGSDLPEVYALHGNVPNPFNPQTVLYYDLPAASKVSLVIYDISGAEVRVLRDNVQEPAGRREAVWDGRNDAGVRVASGVYFCRMKAGAFRAAERMTLVK